MEIIKVLRLISPEHASHLGIPAECPVFVSPGLDAPAQCHLCPPGPQWWDYCPLMYGHGVEVRAQHLHVAEQRGGIYCATMDSPYMAPYWGALGESQAPQWQQWGVVGATAVTLWSWSAICCQCWSPLQAGGVMADGAQLCAVCDACDPPLRTSWQFEIGSDGACHFSGR